MSRDFKLKFDEMLSAQPTDKDGSAEENAYEAFATPGHVRNICFGWPDGRKKFLNYAYLVSGEYAPDDSAITLNFTTDTVIIKGSGLEALFAELLFHLPKVISYTDSRYETINSNHYNVKEITIIAPG